MSMPGKPPPTLRRRVRQKLTHWADPIKPWLRTNVCCFHTSRVGSTVLGDLLGQHPRVLWAGEVLWQDHALRKQQPIDAPFKPIHNPRRVIRHRMHAAGLRTFGMELQYGDLAMYDLTLERVLPWLTRNHFTHFIVQHRRNTLRQITSSAILFQRDKWRQKAGETTRLTQVTLDPEGLIYHRKRRGLLELIEQIHRWHDQTLALLRDRRLLTLIYEDDIEADPRVAYRKACDFLDIDPADVAVRDTKMNPFPLREMIENYDQIAALLRDTPHAWMLEQ